MIHPDSFYSCFFCDYSFTTENIFSSEVWFCDKKRREIHPNGHCTHWFSECYSSLNFGQQIDYANKALASARDEVS